MSAEGAVSRARQYLESADILLCRDDYASSISRSYYAMFYVARALLEQEGIEAKTHSGLRNQFGLHFVKPGRVEEKFSRMLDRAEDLRTLAEYAEAPGAVTETDARATLKDGQAFVAEMRAHLDFDG